jgi:hypothetical protein
MPVIEPIRYEVRPWLIPDRLFDQFSGSAHCCNLGDSGSL